MDWKHIRSSMAAALVGVALGAPFAEAQTTGLKVQYRIPGAAVNDNHVRPHLSVVNTGTTTVPTSELTIRYWYTVDGVRPQVYVCDYTPRGCGNVTSQFVAVSPARTNADFYLQVGFTAGMGSLAAGQSTGEIQGRFNKDNWSNYDESNDYSYDPTKTAFADWTRVTLYRSGVLVWGTEPAGGTAGGDFALAAAAATINAGQSGTSGITITRSGTFTGTVNLTASGQPANVTVALSPAAATGATSTANITVGAAVPSGTYPITITGTAAGITGARTATLSLTVGTGPNFSLAAAPVTISQGASGTSAITITRSSFTGAVSLAASGQPANVTVTLTPASTTGTGSTATITVGAAVPAGTYPITITGTATGITGARTATLNLTVGAGANFSLSASPSSVSIAAGSSGTSTITVARTGSFTGAVTLTGPATVTFSPNPIPAAPATTSVATIRIPAGTPAGTSVITISGTAAGITGTRSTTVNLTVTGAAAVFRVDPTGRITKNGAVFPMQCGSWFGLEGRHEPSNDPTNPSGAPMELYIGNTFWANGGSGTGRTIQQTMSEIVARGINVVRLPVVPQTLNPNDPQGTGNVLKNHPSVRVANSRLALEQFIRLADQNNIEVMLDMHSCSNYVGWRKGRLDARPPYADADRDNYDFKRENWSCSATGNPSSVTNIQPYNQTLWLNDLRTLAGLGQQLGVDNIIGIDIFNEPHDYTWQEWKTLAEAAYQAINAVNPNTLVFVQGISATAGKQDGSPTTVTAVPHGDPATNPNWGENLFEAGTNPINIPKERLVFSPHTYGPSVFVQKMFMDPAQPQCAGLEGDAAGDANCNIVINPALLRAGWEEHFGYLRDAGYAVVVGEFGGNLDWPLGQASLRDRNRWSHITPGVDAQWQNAFVNYMTERGIEGCYWAINPESGDTAGWYGHAYDPISNTAGWGEWRDFDPRKTNLLEILWAR